MPAQTFGYSTTEVLWDFEQTEVDQSSVDFISISCVGYLKEEGATLASAMIAVPSVIDISDDGPVKLALEFEGATLDTRTSSFTGDGRIEVTVVYKIPLSQVFEFPGGENGPGESESDRYDTRVETENVPLMSHPVALEFPLKEKNRLKNLLEGDIIPNPDYEDGGEESEFIYAVAIKDNEEGDDVTFSSTSVTVDGITASPLDYARIIKAGIEVYARETVRWTWTSARSDGPSPAEMNDVGDVVVNTVPNIPDVNNRDWFFTGITDVEEAPDAHNTVREYTLSERGGALKQIYKGGSGSINP